MDKNEEKEREMKEDKSAKFEEVTLPIAAEYGKEVKETLEIIEDFHTTALSMIGEDARSRFSNKRTLSYISNLIELAQWSARLSLIAYFSVDFLNRKSEVLEGVITILLRQIKDLPAPEDIKELREFSTRKTELDSLMQKLKQLTDQAEKEKTEAFRKIDMARQQVLKDIV